LHSHPEVSAISRQTAGEQSTTARRARSNRLGFSLAAIGLALLVCVLWAPFGLRVGPDTDIWHIHGNPEQYRWFIPQPLRPLGFAICRLPGLLTPTSFLAYNLLTALGVLAKGVMLFLILGRLPPRRMAVGFLAAALLMLYPAGVMRYRTNMVTYQAVVFLYLLAVFLLVSQWQRPRVPKLIGMLVILTFALGVTETLLPLVCLTPAVLVWAGGRPDRRMLLLSLGWWIPPVILTGGLLYALLGGAPSASYQSSRIAITWDGLGAAALDAMWHLGRAHFWMGWRSGLESILNAASDATPGQRGMVLLAALVAGAVLAVLDRIDDRCHDDLSSARWAALAVGGLVTLVSGYAVFFPSDLRFSHYRTFFYSSIGAVGVIAAVVALARHLLAAGPGLLKRLRVALLPVLGGGLVGLAMANSHADLKAWDLQSRDEQQLIVEIARQLHAVKSDTLIVVLETEPVRFARRFYVWFYQDALRLVYENKRIHATLCYVELPAHDKDSPLCSFTEEGLRLLRPMSMEREVWPYSQMVALELQPDGRLRPLERLPGGYGQGSYVPQALYSSRGPMPPKVFNYLKYARELVAAGNRDGDPR
jgi:hypothetical protein